MNSYNSKYIYRYYKKNGGILSYRLYKDILAEHNRLISEEIIKGFWYFLPHRLGLIRIVLKKRHIQLTANETINGSVNWGESNKLKVVLLEEKKVLYECKKDSQGNIIWDNGGHKWLVYFTDNHYPMWIMVMGNWVHNMLGYSFTPTWANARALIAYRKENEDVDIQYKEISDGTSRDYLLKNITTENR